MEFQDRVLKCVECGSEFLFTAGEQLFYREKQLTHDPKRCRFCKIRTRMGSSPAPAGRGGGRVETETTCAQCGKPTVVPFKPSQGRPVLCRGCFESKRPSASV